MHCGHERETEKLVGQVIAIYLPLDAIMYLLDLLHAFNKLEHCMAFYLTCSFTQQHCEVIDYFDLSICPRGC